MASIASRLQQQGIVLPRVSPPVGAYVPAVGVGGLVFLSGQLPRQGDGLLHQGVVGREVTLEQAIACAQCCALQLLAQLEAYCGLAAVSGCVKLTGFVAATPDFADHSRVINGASQLLLNVFGEAGRHARSAVGVASLPLRAPVEVEAIFALSGDYRAS